MKKKISASISCLLCLVMIISAMPLTAFSLEEQGEPLTFGHRDIDYTAPVVHIPTNNKGEASVPPSHDVRDYITLPPVRNQNPYGACWAHAMTAALEIAMIKNGLADETVDLSELQLINSSYSDSKDPLGNLDGDATVATDDNPLNLGGNFISSAKVLNRWNAGADEKIMKYIEDDAFVREGGSFTDDFCYGLNEVRLSEYYVLNKENVSDIKKMIVKYGCAVTSYFHDESFVNKSTNAMFNNVYTDTNHEIAVIGWDDNYSRDNFVSTRKPANDGAWLIRNSWGERGALRGYYWLSYEDVSINDDWGFFNVVSADEYDNNYQYDGNNSLSRTGWSGAVANIYTAVSHEYIKAVNIPFEVNTNASYEVRIYKNPSSEKYYVRDDVPAYKGTFSTTYAGIYTAVLDTPVEIEPGENFAVYYKIISCAEGTSYYSCATSADWGWVNNIESVSGKSQIVYDSGYSVPYQADFRIKAFTVLADIATPDNFTATRNGNIVSLSWNPVEGATGYEIYSSVDNKAYAPALTTAETSAVLTASASDGLLHKYKVRAVRGDENGEFSQGRAVRFDRSVRVTSLSGENKTVSVGSEINLNAVISPDNASDKMISYALVSGGEYVSLTNDGILTAEKTGEAVVSAMTRDGAFSADINVTIVGETEHEPASAVIENSVSSTCTVKGSYDSVIYCKNCGEEISRETIETELSAHTPVISKQAVSATCSMAGSTAEYKCSVCQTVTAASQIIPATGKHTGGNAVRENEKASTCVNKGSYDEVKYCTVCKSEVSRKTVTLELKAHSYSVVSSTPATCEKEGIEVRVCTVCGDTVTKTTAKTSHKDSDSNGTCDVCGAVTAKPCSHSCHKSGFPGFIWKITNFFNKIFKINQVCECGVKHW